MQEWQETRRARRVRAKTLTRVDKKEMYQYLIWAICSEETIYMK